jgi:hypothetical protein
MTTEKRKPGRPKKQQQPVIEPAIPLNVIKSEPKKQERQPAYVCGSCFGTLDEPYKFCPLCGCEGDWPE